MRYNKSISFLISLMCFFSVSALSHTIVYINGINNTEEEARNTATHIRKLLFSSKNGLDKNDLKVTFIWNPIGWKGAKNDENYLYQDVKELFVLKAAEEHYYSNFQKILSPFNSPNIVDINAANSVVNYLDDMTPGNNSLEVNGEIDDTSMLLTKNATLRLYKTIKHLNSSIIVAHSQGNLLANLAYAKLASEVGSDINLKTRIVNVANTSLFSVNNLNLTHDRDSALYKAPAFYSGVTSLEGLPSTGKNWNRQTPYCVDSVCDFSLAPPTFGGVDGNGILHSMDELYLSDKSAPLILVDNGVEYSNGRTGFSDRFVDLVYAAANSLHYKITLPFKDDFDDGIDNNETWEFSGAWNTKPAGSSSDRITETSHTENNGVLQLRMDVTDVGSTVRTKVFSPKSKVKVSFQHKMIAGGDYFFPSLTLEGGSYTPLGIANNAISIGWVKSAWAADNTCGGFNRPRISSHDRASSSSECVGSDQNKLSSDLYNKWITTTVVYDSTTGVISVDHESDGVVDMEGTIKASQKLKVNRVAFGGFGWWTGHQHILDFVEISGEN